MTFIKLNHANGPVFVNLDRVIYIDDDAKSSARLWFQDNDFIHVTETLKEVMDIVKRVQRDWPK